MRLLLRSGLHGVGEPGIAGSMGRGGGHSVALVEGAGVLVLLRGMPFYGMAG